MPAPDWLAALPGVLAHEPLARRSQFGVGGPADWFLRVRDADTLRVVMRGCTDSSLPLTVLGAGSNALILDGGIRGVVIRLSDAHLRVLDGAVELGAGAMLPRVALDCARLGLAGLEFGIGVPGSVGAGVYGNAGAFGGEIADVLVGCDVMTPHGELRSLDNAACGFAYRESRLKHELRGHVVISARLRVRAGDPAVVRARTLAIQARRKASQPYGVRSLGSVFKNPPGDTAGRLVEAAGLKGCREGGAEISSKHANFILNVDHAAAADVLALVQRAHDEVKRQFGVDLEREIIVIGDEHPAETRLLA